MLLWGLSVVWPGVVVWLGEFLIHAVTGESFIVERQFGALVARSVIAGFPFIVLASYGQWKALRKGSAAFPGLAFAAILLLFASAVLWGILYYDLFLYEREGVNLRLAAVLLLSPVCLPLLIPLGFATGQRVAARRRRRVSS